MVSNGLIKDIYKVEEDEKKHTDLLSWWWLNREQIGNLFL